MIARKLSQALLFLSDSPFQKIIKVSEAPGNQTKSSHTEECIKDLGVDFYPNAPRGVDIVAIVFAVPELAHCGTSIA